MPYWTYAQKNLEKVAFLDIEDGLAHLKDGQTVIFLKEGMLKGYLKNNPSHSQKLDIFWRDVEFQGPIFPHNSPLVPMFRAGATLLTEKGIEDALVDKWEGMGVDQESGVSTMVLGTGHMILVYVVIAVIFLTCLLIFLGEVAFSAMVKAESSSKKQSRPRKAANLRRFRGRRRQQQKGAFENCYN